MDVTPHRHAILAQALRLSYFAPPARPRSGTPGKIVNLCNYIYLRKIVGIWGSLAVERDRRHVPRLLPVTAKTSPSTHSPKKKKTNNKLRTGRAPGWLAGGWVGYYRLRSGQLLYKNKQEE